MRRLILGLTAIALTTVALATEVATFDVVSARVEPGVMQGESNILIELTAESRQAFADFTSQYVGCPVDLLIDDVVVITPVVREPILGGLILISGIDPDAVDETARRIEAETAIVSYRLAADGCPPPPG